MSREGGFGIYQRGLTLVELMVALAVSFILIGAIYRIFISQQRTYAIQDQVAEAQQNARVAMNILMRDLRMAGYGKPEGSVVIKGETYRRRTAIVFTSKGAPWRRIRMPSPWWGVSDLPRDTSPRPRIRMMVRLR
jgi:prepilin-type N-terminal cleavage/methylation domain-containing protein